MRVMNVPGNFTNDRLIAHHVEKTERSYLLSLVVPGYNKDRIGIQFEADRLVVKAEKEDNALIFARPGFTKRFIVPSHVDVDAISARYFDGILQIEIPFKADYRREVAIS